MPRYRAGGAVCGPVVTVTPRSQIEAHRATMLRLVDDLQNGIKRANMALAGEPTWTDAHDIETFLPEKPDPY